MCNLAKITDPLNIMPETMRNTLADPLKIFPEPMRTGKPAAAVPPAPAEVTKPAPAAAPTSAVKKRSGAPGTGLTINP